MYKRITHKGDFYMTNYSIKLCQHCHNKFKPTSPRQRFCSYKCRTAIPARQGAERIPHHTYKKKKEQLCWICQKACGGCSWSDALIPVKGWDAVKVYRKYNDEDETLNFTYRITSCPQFISDRKEHYYEEIYKF